MFSFSAASQPRNRKIARMSTALDVTTDENTFSTEDFAQKSSELKASEDFCAAASSLNETIHMEMPESAAIPAESNSQSDEDTENVSVCKAEVSEQDGSTPLYANVIVSAALASSAAMMETTPDKTDTTDTMEGEWTSQAGKMLHAKLSRSHIGAMVWQHLETAKKKLDDANKRLAHVHNNIQQRLALTGKLQTTVTSLQLLLDAPQYGCNEEDCNKVDALRSEVCALTGEEPVTASQASVTAE